MNPQLQAILQLLLSGGSNSMQNPQNLGWQSNQNSTQDNSTQLPNFSDFSPINANQNYGSTIKRFFNNNPVAGPSQYTNNPVQVGRAGQNASRGNSGWNSFLGNDPSSIMRVLGGNNNG